MVFGSSKVTHVQKFPALLSCLFSGLLPPGTISFFVQYLHERASPCPSIFSKSPVIHSVWAAIDHGLIPEQLFWLRRWERTDWHTPRFGGRKQSQIKSLGWEWEKDAGQWTPDVYIHRKDLNLKPRWIVRAPKPVAKRQTTRTRVIVKFRDWARFLALVTCTWHP